MSFFARIQNSPYSKLGDEEERVDENESNYEKDFYSIPSEESSAGSSMTSSTLNQYGSLTNRSGTSAGLGISRQQIRLYILIKDLFIRSRRREAAIRRRQLYLFILFDIFFTAFLWIYCLRLQGLDSLYSIFQEEVVEYSVQSSLFDIVVVTCMHGGLLFLFIDITSRKLELLIFISTFVLSSFWFYKLFSYQKLKSNLFVTVLLIQSFVCSWLELFLFDNTVFRHLRDSTRKEFFKSESRRLLESATQTSSLLPRDGSFSRVSSIGITSTPSGYFSTRDDYDVDTFGAAAEDIDRFNAEDLAFIKKGQEVLLLAVDIIFSEGWTTEVKNEIGDIVESKTIVKGMKVFRLQSIVDTPSHNLMKILFEDLEDQPKWNKNLLKSEVVKKIDENTDIVHTVAASKGPVSSRDFVILRHRGAVGESLVISSISTETDLMPVVKSSVRAESGPACFIITPFASDKSKSEFRWLMNTNLKGWLPQKVVDSAFSSVMLEFVQELRKFITENPVPTPSVASSSLNQAVSDHHNNKSVTITFEKDNLKQPGASSKKKKSDSGHQ